mmetsp:Transcript_13059/g.23666  ORF Transcript_13059/g.23666 Transcript_13059/m.23666 type:complete len:271 (-) Transcript_13059:703-1515(-)
MRSIEIIMEESSPFFGIVGIVRGISNDYRIVLCCLLVFVVLDFHVLLIHIHDQNTNKDKHECAIIHHALLKSGSFTLIAQCKRECFHLSKDIDSCRCSNLVNIIGPFRHIAIRTRDPHLASTNGRSQQGYWLYSRLSIGISVRIEILKIDNVDQSRKQGQDGNGSKRGKVETNAQTEISHLLEWCKNGRIQIGAQVIFSWFCLVELLVCLAKAFAKKPIQNIFARSIWLLFDDIARQGDMFKVSPRSFKRRTLLDSNASRISCSTFTLRR